MFWAFIDVKLKIIVGNKTGMKCMVYRDCDSTPIENVESSYEDGEPVWIVFCLLA